MGIVTDILARFQIICLKSDIRRIVPDIQVYARIILNSVDFVEQAGSFTLA